MGDWITSTIIAMGYLGVLLLTLLETVFWPVGPGHQPDEPSKVRRLHHGG